jgi:hypothetical protein
MSNAKRLCAERTATCLNNGNLHASHTQQQLQQGEASTANEHGPLRAAEGYCAERTATCLNNNKLQASASAAAATAGSGTVIAAACTGCAYPRRS